MEKKVKEMKNGYKLQAYPIKLENNDFPSGQDKAEAFVNLHAEYSLSSNLRHKFSSQFMDFNVPSTP